MLTHDIIKIQYSREGYLPDYPYHMISDREMFNAFICIDYKLTISDGGTGYSVGDIMYTDVLKVYYGCLLTPWDISLMIDYHHHSVDLC